MYRLLIKCKMGFLKILNSYLPYLCEIIKLLGLEQLEKEAGVLWVKSRQYRQGNGGDIGWLKTTKLDFNFKYSLETKLLFLNSQNPYKNFFYWSIHFAAQRTWRTIEEIHINQTRRVYLHLSKRQVLVLVPKRRFEVESASPSQRVSTVNILTLKEIRTSISTRYSRINNLYKISLNGVISGVISFSKATDNKENPHSLFGVFNWVVVTRRTLPAIP